MQSSNFFSSPSHEFSSHSARRAGLVQTRVLLVDDHPFVRDGVSGLLASQSDFTIVGQACSVAEARTLLAALKPTLVLVDLRLPDGDGTEILEDIRALRWSTYAVVLSAFCTDDDLVAAARAGARAFLLKTGRGEETLSVLRRVMNGENVLELTFPPALRSRMAQRDLTAKELGILKVIGQGLTNKEISQQTGIAQNTVKVHLRRVFQKLGVTTRAEAAAVAVRRGLVG
jgi:DNA-binding NarL/FixJ family response regulator